MLVAVDGAAAGAILLRDRLRQGVREACGRGSAALGIAQRVMLTGDRRRAAEVIAREAGIPKCEAELLPEQKLERIRQLAAQGRTVAMVGDGINDAPALAAAAVGIAVAGASDITAEAADVVYLPHSLETSAASSSRPAAAPWPPPGRTLSSSPALFNLAAVIWPPPACVGPIGAAVTHQLSSFFVMMNSLRLLRVGGRLPGGAAPRAALSRADAAPARAACAWLDRRRVARQAGSRRARLLWSLNGFYIVPPDELGIVAALRTQAAALQPARPALQAALADGNAHAHSGAPVRVVEIGFRSVAGSPDAEPAAYEWNVQHRSGRFQRTPEESLLLTGDQNMIELNATVHYDLPRPDDFLFRQLDGDATRARGRRIGARIRHHHHAARRRAHHRPRRPSSSACSGDLQSRLDR